MNVRLSSNLIQWDRQLDAVADASTLGFAPGRYPDLIEVQSERTGCVLEYHRGQEHLDNEGDTVAVPYVAVAGPVLLVFNS